MPFVYGGLASCIAEAATFPIDTAKTRLQLQGDYQLENVSGIWQWNSNSVAVQFWHSHGVRTFSIQGLFWHLTITTLSTLTSGITTLSIMAFSLTTSKMRHSRMKLSIMAEHDYASCRLCWMSYVSPLCWVSQRCIKGLFVTLSTNDIQHKWLSALQHWAIMQSIIFYILKVSLLSVGHWNTNAKFLWLYIVFCLFELHF